MADTYNGILSALKKNWHMLQHIWTWRHDAKWNKLDTKEQMVYDSTYMG